MNERLVCQETKRFLVYPKILKSFIENKNEKSFQLFYQSILIWRDCWFLRRKKASLMLKLVSSSTV